MDWDEYEDFLERDHKVPEPYRRIVVDGVFHDGF
ncbi:hypothetical protein CFELI_05420 [Corynebacterium felinum]|uniref:Uncharacterized protein n=1 Tax=Corynebacterium felinum TaxID=131318 RepID=A0ABU2B9R7_9CORY|nr:hypothetical protein [Corynebacterium felinum]WJY94712.1 hypothetical protein CFELI_05420 [Corynebacterium felinum]